MDLIGGWAFVRWQTTYDDGRVTHPFGTQASGFILYTEDGFMSANIMAGDRKPFTVTNPRAASEAERARAFDGYLAYAGRWREDRGLVIHDIEVSSNPSLVGQVQRREASFGIGANGLQQLVLSAREDFVAAGRVHRILWERRAVTG